MAHTVDSIKMYVIIFTVLLVLTFMTVCVAFIDLGFLNVPIALGIAVLKAALVLWFFMHLRHNSALTKLFAAAGFIWLLLLAVFTFCDYFTRNMPSQQPQNSWIQDSASHFRVRPAVEKRAEAPHH